MTVLKIAAVISLLAGPALAQGCPETEAEAMRALGPALHSDRGMTHYEPKGLTLLTEPVTYVARVPGDDGEVRLNYRLGTAMGDPSQDLQDRFGLTYWAADCFVGMCTVEAAGGPGRLKSITLTAGDAFGSRESRLYRQDEERSEATRQMPQVVRCLYQAGA